MVALKVDLRDLFFCKQLALVVNKQGQSTIKTVLLHFVTKSEPNFGHSILKQPKDQKYVYGTAMPHNGPEWRIL